MTDSLIREFVANQRELLELELNSEQDEAGVNEDTSSSQRTVALRQLEKNNISDDKKSKNNNNKAAGNSSKDDDESDEDALVGSAPLTLIPKSSVEVHRKLIAGLAELERHGPNHPIAGPLVEALFAPPTKQSSAPTKNDVNMEPFNDNLDSSQLEAIAFALQRDQQVALIHGPPGTGKTTTVAELIQQAVYHHGMKVLVTAPSNVAVDNIIERLAAISSKPKKKTKATTTKNNNKPLRMVRLGHPARIKPSILKYSLEALVQAHDGTEIVKDVRNELQSFLRILTNPKSRGNDKRLAYREVKALRKEVRTREEKVVQELVSSSQVVLATTVGAASRLLRTVTDSKEGGHKNGFDLVIIDEAAQALEASCWIPILKGRKLVLAGDHCQLPPTVMCKHSKVQKGLGKTLFERIMKLYGDEEKNKHKDDTRQPPRVSRMLKVQYRMHEDISNWASAASYHGDLLTADSVKHRTIGQLVKQEDAEIGDGQDDDDDVISHVPLLLIDTAGCAMYETESSSGSRFNEGEAQVVAKHVIALLEKGIRQEQIAVITPYNGQVELLRTLLLPDHPKLEIRSVDGFQGGEREAVVLSLVRSSERARGKKGDGIGFLRDNRRLNVAVTRAKRHCAVICDSETVSQSKFVKGLLSWIEEHGEQRSGMDYLSGSSRGGMDKDLRDAEIELQKAMADLAKKDQKDKPHTKKVEYTKTDDEAKRKELLDQLSRFAETGKQGEEMMLSTELTSFDRRVVHEFAEQIGLGHRSEGEGQSRRIILKIEKVVSMVVPMIAEDATPAAGHQQDEEQFQSKLPKASTSFAALAIDDQDDDDDDEAVGEVATGHGDTEATPPESNNLLGSLARERELRAKQQKQPQDQAPASASTKKKKKNKKGQKLGGKKPAENKHDDADDGLNDLDDMAFLDKQIEKVQTSHGRQVFGSGNGYKTVINGILISKPPPREQPKNNKASAALQSKLKEAQDGRKAKPKKKK